jgi:hypothetical protein
MALTGKITTFFSDKAKTKPIFPFTKTKAVSDDDGVILDELLDEIETKVNNAMPTPTNAVSGDLLIFNGTKWVSYSKADLIAEVIAALPQVITSTTDVESGTTSSYPEGTLYVVYDEQA